MNMTITNPRELMLDEALTKRRSDLMSYDNWKLRSDLDDAPSQQEADDDPTGLQQLFLDREVAETDMGFWQNRSDELRRQLHEASVKVADARLRYDQAHNEIARLDP